MTNGIGYTRRDVPTVEGTGNPLAPAIPVAAGIQSQSEKLPRLHGAVLTIVKPLETMPPDFVFSIPAGSGENMIQHTWSLRAGIELPTVCTGFRIIGLTYDDLRTMVKINGHGARRVIDRDMFDGLDIKRLDIISAWLSGDAPVAVRTIVQPWGFGGGGGAIPVPVIIKT